MPLLCCSSQNTLNLDPVCGQVMAALWVREALNLTIAPWSSRRPMGPTEGPHISLHTAQQAPSVLSQNQEGAFMFSGPKELKLSAEYGHRSRTADLGFFWEASVGNESVLTVWHLPAVPPTGLAASSHTLPPGGGWASHSALCKSHDKFLFFACWLLGGWCPR